MNMQQKIKPVILSGGVGSRLWPLSRELYPKQFLALVGEETMIQQTILRIDSIVSSPIILCNKEHRFIAAEQLRNIDSLPEAIMLEPCARNTAPAIAAAALHCLQASEQSDELMLVLPADHMIQNSQALKNAISLAAEPASKGLLVTFGIVPERPETGYGYIKAGSDKVKGCSAARMIASFVEKPDYETARKYCDSPDYFWNAGMFMFKPSVFIDELKKFEPQIISCVEAALKKARKETDFLWLETESFSNSKSISIDHAVMEKTDIAAVVPLEAGWSDIGSWSALFDAGQADDQMNIKQGDVICTDTKNCYVRSSKRLVATVGIENQIIVETADAVLVADKSKVQNVKKIVEFLTSKKRQEVVNHLRVSRPWGFYESIDLAERFQVKRITVLPGATLSLQKHHHRSEHWVVVKGTAQISKGDEKFLLTENQSTYIPVGVTHRLANPGKIPLELIEIQSGSYLGEDDIVRFQDEYGR